MPRAWSFLFGLSSHPSRLLPMRYSLQTRAIALLLLGAFPLSALHAGDLSTREAEMLSDAADGQLDRYSLLDASLLASGVRDEAELASARDRLDSLWLEVGQPLIEKLPPDDQIKAIFAATHRLVLTGAYKAECTEVHRTLTSGDYNCVTATIVYLELCRRHGLVGSAVAVPGHVYCRLHGSTDLDIQTTCKEWLDVRAGKAKSATATALAKQLAAQTAAPRQLTGVQLLGKIYYNRGVSLLEQHHYAEAIALLKTSLQLDPFDGPAHNNLLAAHNNWALQLCDAGDYAAAAEKLAHGRAIDSEYVPLQTNDLYVHQKWVLHLCDQGKYSGALDLLEQGFQRRPEVPLFDGGRYAVYGMWSRTLLEANRLGDALTVLEMAHRRFGNHAELVRQEIQAFESGVAQLLKRGEMAAAKAMLAVALRRHPEADGLQALSPKLMVAAK
jgi:hypothetical protein